jgi:CheY-like chemotaxis protein
VTHGAARSERPIDLVITDVFMPGIGGVELTRRLLQKTPDLPVILMSGYHEGSLSLPAAWSDQVRYLEKPFSLETLSDAIQNLLER